MIGSNLTCNNHSEWFISQSYDTLNFADDIGVSEVVNEPQLVWPEKNRQMSIKVAQNDFTRKIIDFDNFTKIA